MFSGVTGSAATWEALVPFFDHARVSVADDLSGDVVIPLKKTHRVQRAGRFSSEQGSKVVEYR